LAPALLALPGCGPLTAAKIIGETAGIDRFKSRDAYARYNGTALVLVWSSTKPGTGRAAPETDKDGRRDYLIHAIPYQDPQQEAKRLRAVHEARVKIVPRA
jgi:hypothetical protein